MSYIFVESWKYDIRNTAISAINVAVVLQLIDWYRQQKSGFSHDLTDSVVEVQNLQRQYNFL